MNDITVAIIEDEKPAARLLENMIHERVLWCSALCCAEAAYNEILVM